MFAAKNQSLKSFKFRMIESAYLDYWVNLADLVMLDGLNA